jgi:hypothetical protein
MKKLCAALAAVFLFILVAPALAAEVTGELVDQACYMKDQKTNVGSAHQECAVTCAKKGQTVALVTDAGEVYVVAGNMTNNNNARLVPHMSHKVVLVGSLGVENGKKAIYASGLKMVSK